MTVLPPLFALGRCACVGTYFYLKIFTEVIYTLLDKNLFSLIVHFIHFKLDFFSF